MVEQDRELEDYLAGRSPVSRAYRQAAPEEPGAELDTRIREAARATVPRFSERGRPRWLLPLSAAAAVLLAFTLLIEMQKEGFGPVPVEKMEPAAPVAAPAPSAGTQMQEPMAAPAPEPASTEPPGVERRALQKSLPQPFPAAPESASDAAAPVGSAAGSAAPRREGPAPAEAMPEAAEGRPRADLEEEPPEAWIERIRRLIAEGQTEAAKTEYGKFRVRFPEHPLPEDLKTAFEVP